MSVSIVGQIVAAGEVGDARGEEGGLHVRLAADPWHDIARVPELVPGAEEEVAKVDLVFVYPVNYIPPARIDRSGTLHYVRPLVSHSQPAVTVAPRDAAVLEPSVTLPALRSSNSLLYFAIP